MLKPPTIDFESLPFDSVICNEQSMFGHIPRNVYGYFSECLATIPGMFGDIPLDVSRHSPEYNIPPIPRAPHIPFPVLVLVVLYIDA